MTSVLKEPAAQTIQTPVIAVASALPTDNREMVEPEPWTSSAPEEAGARSSVRGGLWIMAAAIVLSLLSTMGLMLALTNVSVLAAFGLGLYCAFWLGGGFGTIFGSAFVFGRDH